MKSESKLLKYAPFENTTFYRLTLQKAPESVLKMCSHSPTWWKLKWDGEAIMWTWALWPLQLRVERVQDVKLHGFEEAVTFVFKYDWHHDLTAILQVALDVIHLRGRGKRENDFHKTKVNVQLLLSSPDFQLFFLTPIINKRTFRKHCKSSSLTQHQSTHYCFQETSLTTTRKSRRTESFSDTDRTIQPLR